MKSLPEDLCSGFSRPEKIHQPQPGLDLRTLDLETSMLPRDHRGQHLYSEFAYIHLLCLPRNTMKVSNNFSCTLWSIDLYGKGYPLLLLFSCHLLLMLTIHLKTSDTNRESSKTELFLINLHSKPPIIKPSINTKYKIVQLLTL